MRKCYTFFMIGTNFEMKKNNVLKVFAALCKEKSLSRKEIEEKTELSWGTVSTICNDLIAHGVLTVQKQNGGLGRPSETLSLSLDNFLLLGVDVNSVGLCFNVVNLAGVCVFNSFCEITTPERESVLNALVQELEKILTNFTTVVALCVSMQGKIDAECGVSVRAHFFKDWENVPVVSFLEERFHLPTFFYHDTECLLAYHLDQDERVKNLQNGFVVRMDEGVGMAMMIRGVPYQGRENPEIGHTMVKLSGKKGGVLEDFASFSKLKSDGTLTAAHYTATAVYNLYAVLSPDFILLDGKSVDEIPNFFEQVLASLTLITDIEVPLIKARYKRDAAAIGACLLSKEKVFETVLF